MPVLLLGLLAASCGPPSKQPSYADYMPQHRTSVALADIQPDPDSWKPEGKGKPSYAVWLKVEKSGKCLFHNQKGRPTDCRLPASEGLRDYRPLKVLKRTANSVTVILRSGFPDGPCGKLGTDCEVTLFEGEFEVHIWPPR